MSVLGKNELLRLLHEPNPEARLYVSPMLSKSQIGSASIDLRLGNDFVVWRRSNLSAIDPIGDPLHEHRHHERRNVNFGEPFYLHPNELVLATTLEHIRIPNSVAAVVTSRSSWGRAGLIIATATAVHPGFCGTITLELLNHGGAPMKLYPGYDVAQIVFSYSVGAESYAGRFSDQTGAKNPSLRIGNSTEAGFWCKRRPFSAG